jgi:ABC-type multidrug transport system fused ATPase/permease subunit
MLRVLAWAFRTVWAAAPVEWAVNLAANVVAGALTGANLLLTKQLIDAIAAGAPAAAVLKALVWLAGALVAADLAQAVEPATRISMGDRVDLFVQERVLQKASGLSLAQFDDTATYDVLERAGSGHANRLAMVSVQSMLLLKFALQLISAVTVVALASPWAALVACLVAVPIGWAGTRQGKRLLALFQQQTHETRLVQYLSDLLTDRPAATELRAYQLLPVFLRRWGQAVQRLQGRQMDVRVRGMREGFTADLGATALFAGALVLFAGMAGRGALSAGSIVAAATAIRTLRDSSSALAQNSSMVWEYLLPLAEFRAFLSKPGAEPPPDWGEPFPGGAIRLEGVSFRYPGQDGWALESIDLEIRPGEKVALVGANGSGKSTLVKLLLGLYAPTAGRITVGGVPLAAIAPGALRAAVSCIFQDFARFDMTLAENVRMGRPGAAEGEVEAACRLAGAAGVAESLPQGYATMLGKTFGGIDLSGGQWQRVALARAFVREASVLVLDEPTAALDARAELDLFERFVHLAAGRTTILISHRLGMARLADRVVVLDGGRVAEQGSHDRLLAAGGLYAGLFRTQAQWYAEPAPAVEEVAG